jgi:integrase
MASIVKRQNQRGDRWVARVRRRGRDVCESFATKRQAEAWARDQESLLDTSPHARGLGPRHTTVAAALRDYANLYSIQKKGIQSELARINRYLCAAGLPALRFDRNLTGATTLSDRDPADVKVPPEFARRSDAREKLRQRTNALRKRLACMPVAGVAPHFLREFCNSMLEEGLTGDTVRLEMALLRNLFNRAIDEWGWTTISNPLKGFKLPRRNPARDRRLTAAEEVRLAAALQEGCHEWLGPYIALAIETAMRRGELLLGTTWNEVNFDERYITLRDTKNGSGRRVPLTRRAVEILRALPRQEGEPRVFPITPNALKCAWTRVCKRAGIEGLRVHDLRHESLSRHAKRLGGNAFLLKKVSGHKTLQMLDRYVNLDVTDVLEAWHESEPPSPPALPDILPENVVRLPRRNGKLARGLNAIGGRS